MSEQEEKKTSEEDVKASDTPEATEDDVLTDDEISEDEPAEDSVEETDETNEDSDADELNQEPEAEEEPASEPAPTPTPAEKKSGFPLILGGVVAAAVGFGTSLVVPDGWPIGADNSETRAQISAQQSEIASLTERLDSLNNPDPDAAIAPVEAWVTEVTDQLRSDLDGITATLASLDERIETLEKRPVSGDVASEDAVAAYECDVVALREQLESQRAEIDAMLANAQAQSAAAQLSVEEAKHIAALSAIEAALNNGSDYSSALADLMGTAPAALFENAAGVPTQEALEDGFIAPARDAIAASLAANVEDGSVSRVGGFLRDRLGLRSLTPQDGEDANAILSRAEFALQERRIADAITEIAALPQDGQDLMAAWVAEATQRMAALAALSELKASAPGAATE
ncbi:hypothetical protein [Thalassobius sp. I31.1]|uniref:COG4223 family protein n=1 Tax=Thalassobius sp. I31.1 TaxID=2109912 RepID=UPI001300AD30|nr:hypothetical protein [Thalassobius sp. I31.1]